MATILDLYNKNKTLSQDQGGPDAARVDANISIDQIPYSAGENIQGGKGPDVGAIDKAADSSVISPGNRYGIIGSDIGTGIAEYKTILGPAGIGALPRESWNDTKKYGDINREG